MGKGRSYINSYADRIMREKVIEEVGTLLDHILNEGITTPKEIYMDFGVDHKTISALRKLKSTITFETIRKFGYVIAYYLQREYDAIECGKKWTVHKDEDLEGIHMMKEAYKSYYGTLGTYALQMIKEKKDLRQVVKHE